MEIIDYPLSIKHLSKSYGDFKALDDVSFHIEPGEIFGLLGPNGAGKTTIVSTIVSLEKASSGTISVFGKETTSNPRFIKEQIGFVPQELVHHQFFNILEILTFHSSYFGMLNNKSYIEILLRKMHLWDHRFKLVSQLSGGMKRRLLICKALVHKPRILLLDEPTAGVDIELRSTLWEFVLNLREKNLSILLTTHYLKEAELLCDRIGILQNGKLKTVDKTSNILKLTSRKITIVLKHPLPPLSHSYLIEQQDLRLEFILPSDITLSHLLRDLPCELGMIKDLYIREGTLEDAFQHILKE